MTAITTHWRRRLRTSGQPAYLLLADLIAEDVRHGRLAARDRLPPLRELADDLRLNYSTVARGYAEARRRGLIDSRVGMGTYVRAGSASPRTRGTLEMTMNLPPEPADAALLARLRDGAAGLFAATEPHELLRYQEFGGAPHDRAVAAHWLGAVLPGARLDALVLTPGVHAALATLLGLLARPGEWICVESLTYPGLKAIAAHLGLRLHALPMDADGPLPDALEHAIRTLGPRALYCNPTLLNPTTATVPIERREALARIAVRHGLAIVEDDAYGLLPSRPTPPLATFAPALTWYLSGLSKCFGAGLRSGCVLAPSPAQAQRLAAALRATTVMGSPVTQALATRWIEDGTAAAMLDAVRRESAARQQIAARLLGAHGLQAHPEGFHAWLPLAAGFDATDTAALLRAQGVAAVASQAFATDGEPPAALRLCLGGPQSTAACEQALQRVVHVLEHPHASGAMAL
ncbi:MAG: PLP-dependent aminotransferase family protein [Burkholderiales bacterium]|nr:PLP-dependent aminotransferase family protein [Burkholderiales bacterium]